MENFEEAIEKKEKIELIRQELARNVDLDSLLSAAPRLQHYSRPDIVICTFRVISVTCTLQ